MRAFSFFTPLFSRFLPGIEKAEISQSKDFFELLYPIQIHLFIILLFSVRPAAPQDEDNLCSCQVVIQMPLICETPHTTSTSSLPCLIPKAA